jgi:hypothetical protein
MVSGELDELDVGLVDLEDGNEIFIVQVVEHAAYHAHVADAEISHPAHEQEQQDVAGEKLCSDLEIVQPLHGNYLLKRVLCPI